MVVGELAESADLVVVGGGPGGYVAALRAAQLGREAVVIERHGAPGLGGTCVQVGCIPSKALIELAHARGAVARMASRGLVSPEPEIDLAVFQADKTRIVRRLSDGVGLLLKRSGVTVIEGSARFTGPNRVAVERPDAASLFLEFRHTIVASGSRPVELGALPRDGTRILDSTDVLALDRLPEAVAIVGAGYIGLELASALNGLGVDVTVLELADQLLPGVDPAVSRVLRRALSQRGVRLVLDAAVTGDDGTHVAYETGGTRETLAVDHVVVVAGRRPNSDGIGLRELGVEAAPDGTVPVSPARLATDHVAVIGDLTAGPALAHKAMAEGRIAAEALSGQAASIFDPAAIPAVVYTHPEIAVTGESESSAAAAGLDVAVTTIPLTAIGRSLTLGATEGLARVLSDRATGRVVGVGLVGEHVSELIAEATLAIEMGATLDDLAATIHPHPTMSEALNEAAHLAAGSPVHVAG